MQTLSTNLRQENNRHYSPQLHIAFPYLAFILHSAADPTTILHNEGLALPHTDCNNGEWSYCAKTHGQPVCYVPYDQHHNDRAIDRLATKFKSSISLWIQSTDKSVRAVMNPGKCRSSTQPTHTKAPPTVTLVRNQRTKKLCGKSKWKMVMQKKKKSWACFTINIGFTFRP